jgi:hypothetical protein
MTVIARTILFFSAWVPAFVLLALRVRATNEALALAFGILSIAALGGLWVLFAAFRRVKPKPMTVSHPENQAEQVVSFLVAYLLPFVIPDYSDSFTVIALGSFFMLLWILYVRGQLALNPVLLLFGWGMWRADIAPKGSTERESVVLIVDDTDLRDGETLWIYQVDSPIRLGRRGTLDG